MSYIQDGQASTNAIFGTVGNSAPGLDAVEELQVLSNSYSAEYGGLAGVVVTTKRGSQQYRGTGFFDYNSDGLNALTYNQTLAGVERGDPLSDTHERRWGGSIGGPLFGSKLFFYGNYEGSNDKAIYGGGRSNNIPTAAMRAGDFRGTVDSSHAIRRRARPFPDQVIPADRIDPSATKIMNMFYPLPNLGTAASGYGLYQQFVPETRKRQRFDIRLDSEVTKNDSVFFRGSYQHRDPNSITFEAGNVLTNMPILDSKLEHVVVHRRLDEDHDADDGQRVPDRLQLRQLETAEQFQGRPRWPPVWASRTPRARSTRSGSRRSSSSADRRRTVRSTSRTPAGTSIAR